MDISYNDSNINIIKNSIVGNEDFLGNNYTEPNYEINNKSFEEISEDDKFYSRITFYNSFPFQIFKDKNDLSYMEELDYKNKNNLSNEKFLEHLSIPIEKQIENNLGNNSNDNIIPLLEDEAPEKESQFNSLPIFYNFDKIKNEILPYLNLTQNSKKKLISDKNILLNIEQNTDNFDLLNKKLSSSNSKYMDLITIKYKAGRKNKEDKTFRMHNNYSDDNIIKKIKKYIFEYALSFLNQILNLYIDTETKISLFKKIKKNNDNDKVNQNGNLLKLLEYKIIKRVKKDIDLKILNTPLKILFYDDISSKLYNFKKDSNKIIIDEIMEKEKGNEIIMYAFNMKLEEWFDFFCYKKEIKFLENIEKEKDIKFERADIILNEIAEKNDDAYFTKFIFYFYNYKRWFLEKKGRKTNQ